MLAPFHYAFVQRGVLEALLLSIPAGILGTWIVLRGLAFFSHAVGTAAFPGLVAWAGRRRPAPRSPRLPTRWASKALPAAARATARR